MPSNVRVLILAAFVLDENVARAPGAGAGGLLGKDAESDELLAGVRTVAAGEAPLSPTAIRVFIGRFLCAPDPGAEDPARGPEGEAARTAHRA